MINKKLNGKIVLITGASSGLGEQMARICAQNGAHLILIARNVEKLCAMKNELEHTYKVRVSIYKADLGNLQEIDNVFTIIFKDVQKIDVVVNNAGFGLFKPLLDTSMNEAYNMFSVNTLGLIAVTKQVLPMMIKSGGHIINIASQGGKISTPKSSIYSATKSAVIAFSNSLRMEVGPYGVYVTTVNPGPIETNFFQIADQSGNYLKNVGRWVLNSEVVAKRIVKKMLTPTREINMPYIMNVGSVFYTLFPSLVEKLGKNAFNKK